MHFLGALKTVEPSDAIWMIKAYIAEGLRCHIRVIAQEGPWTVGTLGLRTSGAILG